MKKNIKSTDEFFFVPNVPKKYIGMEHQHQSIVIPSCEPGIPAERQGSHGPVYVMSMRWSIEHSDKNQKLLMDWLKTSSDDFVFQAEDTKDNPHYQGYVKLKEKKRPKQLGSELNDRFYGIQFLPASNEGKMALKNYCLKSDTRVAGPWSDKPVYMGKDLPGHLWDWQGAMRDLLLQEPDDRTVYWIADEVGNTGKSKFLKYMAYKHNALLMSYGSTGNLLNIVSKNIGRKIYMFDLTRSKPLDIGNNDLYAALENIKNGVIMNTKYETSANNFMDPPHVLVMANYMPDVKKLSLDRWKFLYIQNKKLYRKK